MESSVAEEPDTDAAASRLVRAGAACVDLIAHPADWINRRVETIELLHHEETRRRVSIDFTLSEECARELEITDGVVVPISLLTKAPRRNFDLRDESGRAVPVLGRDQNGHLAHIAVLSAALNTAEEEPDSDAFGRLSAHLREIVFSAPDEASEALSAFAADAVDGDELKARVWTDGTCQNLLTNLWQHYALFAVLAPGGPARRVLKYSYGDAFDMARSGESYRERFAPNALAERLGRPDRARFFIECPGAWRAASFHAEIATPEELRFDGAVLFDLSAGEAVSDFDIDVNRASLYANRELDPDADVGAYVEITPERSGRIGQAAVTSAAVAALLWFGVVSDLDAESPGAAVSLLLAGAAVFSGVAAGQGEHKLVRMLFSTSRRWLGVVTVAALAGSATFALEYPSKQPVDAWTVAAIACTVAFLRLGWAGVRAPP